MILEHALLPVFFEGFSNLMVPWTALENEAGAAGSALMSSRCSRTQELELYFVQYIQPDAAADKGFQIEERHWLQA